MYVNTYTQFLSWTSQESGQCPMVTQLFILGQPIPQTCHTSCFLTHLNLLEEWVLICFVNWRVQLSVVFLCFKQKFLKKCFLRREKKLRAFCPTDSARCFKWIIWQNYVWLNLIRGLNMFRWLICVNCANVTNTHFFHRKRKIIDASRIQVPQNGLKLFLDC